MQGGQIIDNALCGGPDPNAGITSTSIPISASAAQMVKAAIFMGDPRFEYGASYEIGTCKLGGVRISHKHGPLHGSLADLFCNSLLRVQRATRAAMDLKFSRIVILPILIAAKAMMRALTRRTSMSMGRARFPLLRPS